MSSLRSKALCIDINFLVFWFICLRSSLIHFENGPEYLISGNTKVFIPLMRFLLPSLISRCFLVYLRKTFLIFLPSQFVWCFPLPTFLFYFAIFIIYKCSNSLSWLASSVTSVICFFHFSSWSSHMFLYQIPFLYPGYIFLLSVSESPILLNCCKQLNVVYVRSAFKKFPAFFCTGI